MDGYKISDIAQLILALILDFGLFRSKKSDVKFSRVFIRYKDTHFQKNKSRKIMFKNIIFLVFSI